jgi:serine protease inhibitor
MYLAPLLRSCPANLSRALVPSLLLLVTGLCSCRKSVPSPDITRALDLPAGSAQVIASGNQFAMNIFGTVLQKDTVIPNELISPFSIYMALSMLYNGAEGPTRDSMAVALQQTGISIDQLNTVNNALIQQLPTEDSKVRISIANSLWYQQNGPQPLPGYVNVIGGEYDGYLKALDFRNSSCMNTINSWVADKTNNKIKSIINALSPETIMVLANAIYFNGPWHFAVDASNSRNLPFYLSDGGVKNVPTMGIKSELRVYDDPAYSLIELPYGGGESFGMYIALPANPQQPIRSFANAISEPIFSHALSGLDSENVDLFLPKWELSYGIDNMLPNLGALGMGIVANPGADFSSMFSTPTYVSQVIHKTYIDVSEQGTEAAAATVIDVVDTFVPNIPAIQVNHPFIYFIVEKQTGAILFMGIMDDPSLAT